MEKNRFVFFSFCFIPFLPNNASALLLLTTSGSECHQFQKRAISVHCLSITNFKNPLKMKQASVPSLILCNTLEIDAKITAKDRIDQTTKDAVMNGASKNEFSYELLKTKEVVSDAAATSDGTDNTSSKEAIRSILPINKTVSKNSTNTQSSSSICNLCGPFRLLRSHLSAQNSVAEAATASL